MTRLSKYISKMTRNPLRTGCLVVLTVFITVALLGGIPVLLRLPAQLICVCDDPSDAISTNRMEPYDVMILLMGDLRARRVEATAEYFRKGVSTRIQIVQPEQHLYEEYGLVRPEANLARDLAIKLGVPSESISLVYGPAQSRAHSTFEEAQFHLLHLASLATGVQNKPTRILLVTDWYHTRRARWIFRKVFKGEGFVIDAAPARREWVDKWWTDEAAFLGLFSEYLKWTHNFLKYGP